MVKANELLLWLSARGEGSWRAFRTGVETLCIAEDSEVGGGGELEDEGFPLHQRLRLNMERLAHVEFFARECESGWRVVPPTLAAIRGPDGWIGVLCGARSGRLLELLAKTTSQLQVEKRPQADAPDAYRVFASSREELFKVAEQSGLHFQADPALAILSCLPPTDPATQRSLAAEFPCGGDWGVDQFLQEDLGWTKVSRADANSARTGFFRFIIHFQRPRYFLRQSGHTRELPRAVGIYALLRRHRHNVLRYDRDACSLTLPAVCRPLPLLERALVLCSGMPPTFDGRDLRLTYSDVQLETARFVAQLLHQSLL